MASPKSDLPQGTLDLLILKTVALGPVHGYAIAQRLQQISRDVVQVPGGSLYPALHRMERERLISGSWNVTENGRRARVYRLTEAGKGRLAEARSSWRSVAKGVKKVLKFAGTVC